MVVINPPQYRASRSLFMPSRVFSGTAARHGWALTHGNVRSLPRLGGQTDIEI
jgi:hypothetical protein